MVDHEHLLWALLLSTRQIRANGEHEAEEITKDHVILFGAKVYIENINERVPYGFTVQTDIDHRNHDNHRHANNEYGNRNHDAPPARGNLFLLIMFQLVCEHTLHPASIRNSYYSPIYLMVFFDRGECG